MNVQENHLEIPNEKFNLPSSHSGTQAVFYQRGLLALCLSALLYGMLQVLHPVAARLLPYMKEREAVSALVHRYGNSTISYFALGEERSYFFSMSGKSVISYVLEGNVAVVAGDPIGPEEEMGFSMGYFDMRPDEEQVSALAVDSTNRGNAAQTAQSMAAETSHRAPGKSRHSRAYRAHKASGDW